MISRSDYKSVPKTWDDEIILISVSSGVDEDGFPTDGVPIKTSVMANRLPVNSSEFYQSSKEGYIISEAFEIHTIEYKGEQSLTFEGDSYQIRRTFRKDDYTELYCERSDVNHG